MNELRINKDLVTHIKIYDLEYSGYYYLPEIKVKTWWGGTKVKQEEGIYKKYRDWWIERKYSVEYFEKEYKFVRIKDKYYEPIHIMIFAGETKLKYKRFNSLQEAKEYCDREFPNIKTI
jgi:hypothetical protein